MQLRVQKQKATTGTEAKGNYGYRSKRQLRVQNKEEAAMHSDLVKVKYGRYVVIEKISM